MADSNVFVCFCLLNTQIGRYMQVRQYLMEGQRQDLTRQAVINITEDAVWNLMSACSNTGMLQHVAHLRPSSATAQCTNDSGVIALPLFDAGVCLFV